MFFKKELENTRIRFANRKKKIKLPKNKTLSPKDPIYKVYTDFEEIIENGNICYACIVRANTKLFKRFPNIDCPAEIVYSSHPKVEERPMILQGTANYLYSLRNKSDSEISEGNLELAEHMRNDYDRAFYDFKITKDGEEISCSTKVIMVFRSFLPGRKIKGKIIPVIVTDDPANPAIIVPYKYWGRAFKRLWAMGLI